MVNRLIRLVCLVLVLGLFSAQVVSGVNGINKNSNSHVSYAPSAHPPVLNSSGVTASKMTSNMLTGPESNPSTVGNQGYCYYGSCYYWATMADTGLSGTGVTDNMTIAKPIVGANDFHSLAELAVESSDQQQIVEIGWTVDRGVNNGDSNPHLFVYHWVNGAPTCYNGCGFVSTSTKFYPGMVLKSGTTASFGIQYTNTGWVLSYAGTNIGSFPNSLWSTPFNSFGITQAFGEVSATSPTAPTSQMGNGITGTNRRSAVISNLTISHSANYPRMTYAAAQAPNTYTIGFYNTACTNNCGMQYGGSGY